MLINAVAALLGLVVGSFLNVVIYRLPVMLERGWRRDARLVLAPDEPLPPEEPPFNLASPRSCCPSCKTPIKARHNVPVLGWLWLRGRCASCRVPIPLRYPAVEALTGLVSALVAMRFGLSLEGMGALLLCWSLIVLAFIDLDHQILPDIITLPLTWAGLLFALAGGDAAGHLVLADLRSAVIGAMAGYLSLWLVYHGFRLLTGKEGMGHGDFKLLAALGAWLGWQMLPLIIMLSALVGASIGIALVVLRGRNSQQPLPFGPFLAAAGFVALLWGQPIIDAYRHFSGL
ncbi:leader peptidase (prepilin peptidase) / N-methyltransferase [Gammaproteobacteria bacterium]|nr:leader peptidase (prepilin peptidase) / N-methyltransferase [Gammaproteobacteria bacterium]